ncbi:MAG: glycerophosphodiester phosphodiesterase [Alphaproteobacteria bacterium]
MQLNKNNLCAHRGYSSCYPENTMVAFQAVHDLGLNHIECDLSLLGDGTVVIHHDGEFGRTVALRGRLLDYSWSDITGADAGSHKDGRYAYVGIPRLDELLDWASKNQMSLNLELKVHAQEGDELVSNTLSILRNFPDCDIMFSSFHMDIMERLSVSSTSYPCAPLFDHFDAACLPFINKIGAGAIHLNGHHLTKDSVGFIKNQNLILRCYTVNQASIAHDLLEWGCDAIISDLPSEILDISTVKPLV